MCENNKLFEQKSPYSLPFYRLFAFFFMLVITHFPFPVLTVTSASGSQQVFEGELLSEPFTLHGICCQQICACLFLGEEENLRTAKVIENNTEIVLAILVLSDGDGVCVFYYCNPYLNRSSILTTLWKAPLYSLYFNP